LAESEEIKVSVAFTVTTIGDGGAKQLDELLARAGNLVNVNEVMGRAGANLVKKHFVELDHHGNSQGGTSTHFYGHAAASTQSVGDTTGATISINQIGVSLIFHGGTVHPVVKKLLAIPAIPEAHGRHPSEFQNLGFKWGKDKNGIIRPIALVEESLGAGTTSTARGRFQTIPVREGVYQAGIMKGHAIHPRWHSGGGEDPETWPRVFFWMSLESKIGQHPDTLPAPGDIAAEASEAGMRFLLRNQHPREE
jgi:hypothetical protein